MRKVLKNIVTVFVLVVCLATVAGCGKTKTKTNSKPLVGSWEHSGYVYTFNDDKTGSYDALGNKMTFTYEDDGKKVSILYKGNTAPSSYEYKIEGKKLIIKDSFGSDVEYTKK